MDTRTLWTNRILAVLIGFTAGLATSATVDAFRTPAPRAVIVAVAFLVATALLVAATIIQKREVAFLHSLVDDYEEYDCGPSPEGGIRWDTPDGEARVETEIVEDLADGSQIIRARVYYDRPESGWSMTDPYPLVVEGTSVRLDAQE